MGFSKKYLTIILFFSLILRIIYVTLFLDPQKYYWEDGIHYYTAAENFFNTAEFGLDAERNDGPFGLEPIYSIFLSFLMIFKNSFVFFRIVQSLVAVFSAFLFFKLLRYYFNENISLIGVAIYSFYPFYFYFSGVILPESIYTPILIYLGYLLVKFTRKRRLKTWILISITLAFLIHVKVTSLSLFLFLLIPFKFFSVKSAANYFLLAISLILLLSTPWAIRNYNAFDKVTLPRNYGGGNDGPSEALKRFDVVNKNGVIFSISKNIYYLFTPELKNVASKNKFTNSYTELISLLSVFPLLLSTLVTFFMKERKKFLLMYIYLLVYCLPYILLFGQTRYRIPIDFIMIIFLLNIFYLLNNRFKILKVV
jgi:4-amino-4-deoxy-L-arabinose transferase-like glycosyltransferase